MQRIEEKEELDSITYHVKDGVLEIPQHITLPANIKRIAEYVRAEDIHVVALRNVSSACFAAVVALIEECGELRSLELHFKETVSIDLALINAIKNHKNLFRLIISNMVLDIVNELELNNFLRDVNNNWKKFIIDDRLYARDKEKRRDELSREYIAAHQELFKPLAKLEVYEHLWELFSSTSLAILELPDLVIPKCADAVKGVPGKYHHDGVIYTYFDNLPLRKYASNVESAFHRSARLCLVTLKGADDDRSDYTYVLFKDKNERLPDLYARMLQKARNHFTQLQLLDAKEHVVYLEWLVDALLKKNGTFKYDFNRFPVPNNDEFLKLQKDINLLLTMQYDFDDVQKRHQVFSEIWGKRANEPSCLLFLINTLLSADASQLPFLAEPYFKYLLLIALLESKLVGQGDLQMLSILRHAYHNAIRAALDPAVASDEMSEVVEGEAADQFSYDRCVFFCTLGRLMQQVSKRLHDSGSAKLAQPFNEALQAYPCDMDTAKILLDKLSQPEVMVHLKQCDEYSDQLIRLLQAFLQPNCKGNLFISIKEQAYKDIQSWINDPRKFEKNKLKQQERSESIRLQREQVDLLKQQVALLQDIKQSLAANKQVNLQVSSQSDISSSLATTFFRK